jgi:hypothetical protein
MKKKDISAAASALSKARWAKPTADRNQPREAGKLGGRPAKLIPCPRGCGHQSGVAAMRSHRCENK